MTEAHDARVRATGLTPREAQAARNVGHSYGPDCDACGGRCMRVPLRFGAAKPAVLPENSDVRKELPIYSGFIKYFPRAMAAVAYVSLRGNQKHNPGEPLHWSRDKSNDHLDCAARHMADAGGFDKDGLRHSAMLAWRTMANLEIELENAETAGQLSEDGIRSDP